MRFKNDNISSFWCAKALGILSNWKITNLEMQKILYLCHMVYSGKYGKPLITDEEFEAWSYGPVLPKLYRELKIFGNKPIKDVFPFTIDENMYEFKFLSGGYNYLSKFSPAELVATTHKNGGAWAKNYNPMLPNNTIPFPDIVQEYRNEQSEK